MKSNQYLMFPKIKKPNEEIEEIEEKKGIISFTEKEKILYDQIELYKQQIKNINVTINQLKYKYIYFLRKTIKK